MTDAESSQEPFGIIHLADEESSPVTCRTRRKNFEAELAKITWLSMFDGICGTAAIVIHIYLLLWALHGLRNLNTLSTIWIPILFEWIFPLLVVTILSSIGYALMDRHISFWYSDSSLPETLLSIPRIVTACRC